MGIYAIFFVYYLTGQMLYLNCYLGF